MTWKQFNLPELKTKIRKSTSYYYADCYLCIKKILVENLKFRRQCGQLSINLRSIEKVFKNIDLLCDHIGRAALPIRIFSTVALKNQFIK